MYFSIVYYNTKIIFEELFFIDRFINNEIIQKGIYCCLIPSDPCHLSSCFIEENTRNSLPNLVYSFIDGKCQFSNVVTSEEKEKKVKLLFVDKI